MSKKLVDSPVGAVSSYAVSNLEESDSFINIFDAIR